MDGIELRLVGGDADLDHGREPEPPAPLSFKRYAALFPRISRRPNHVELEGHPLPFRLPTNNDVDDYFATLSRKIDDLARLFGVERHDGDDDDDTDRPRAA